MMEKYSLSQTFTNRLQVAQKRFLRDGGKKLKALTVEKKWREKYIEGQRSKSR